MEECVNPCRRINSCDLNNRMIEWHLRFREALMRFGAIAGFRISFGAVMALLAVLTSHESLAETCPPPRDFALHVATVSGDIARDSSRSLVEIYRLLGPEAVATHVPTLGLWWAGVGHVLTTDDGVTQSDAGTFCAAPRTIAVRIGYVDRTAFIAKEASADTCLYRAVLEHLLAHAHGDDEALEAFVPILSEKLRAFIAHVKLAPATSAAAARSKFADAAYAKLQELVGVLNERRYRLQRDIDTDAHLAKLRNACNGRGVRLQLQATKP